MPVWTGRKRTKSRADLAHAGYAASVTDRGSFCYVLCPYLHDSLDKARKTNARLTVVHGQKSVGKSARCSRIGSINTL